MYAGNPDPSPNLNPNPNFTNPRRNLDFYNPNKGTWILQPKKEPGFYNPNTRLYTL